MLLTAPVTAPTEPPLEDALDPALLACERDFGVFFVFEPEAFFLLLEPDGFEDFELEREALFEDFELEREAPFDLDELDFDEVFFVRAMSAPRKRSFPSGGND